jgi:hypothetical protein
MTLTPPIAWCDFGRSALRAVLLTTAAVLISTGIVLSIVGTQLQHLGEKLGR